MRSCFSKRTHANADFPSAISFRSATASAAILFLKAYTFKHSRSNTCRCSIDVGISIPEVPGHCNGGAQNTVIHFYASNLAVVLVVLLRATELAPTLTVDGTKSAQARTAAHLSTVGLLKYASCVVGLSDIPKIDRQRIQPDMTAHRRL